MDESASVCKGSVTALSSMFPVEEAQRAAKRVQQSISEREKEVENLNRFVSENNSLLKLVQKVPDQLSHNIMVPFGKAAFFPGQLIHTNEFLVLLGEGYYAEGTSKQTAEILHRRGKVLDSKLESLKANLLDLQAEASFFKTTASEAAEGLVEIREDYIEEQPTEKRLEPGFSKSSSSQTSEADKERLAAEDKEYARIMSRLAELEKEEQEAATDDEDSDSKSGVQFSDDQLTDSVQKFMNENVFDTATSRPTGDQRSKLSLVEKSKEKSSDPYQFDDIKGQLGAKGEYLHGKDSPESSNVKPFVSENPSPLSRRKDFADFGSKIAKSPAVNPPKIENKSVDAVVNSTPKVNAGSQRKAFTGSIVEHTHGLPFKPPSETPNSSQGSNTSKPVSRFKMQKAGRS